MLTKSLLYTIKSIFTAFAEVLAPRHCEVCHEPYSSQPHQYEYICDKCLTWIPYSPEPAFIINRLFEHFPGDELAISRADSLYYIKEESDFMNLIYSLKYAGFSRIGLELGKLLGRRLEQDGFDKYDAIIPIPIHHARKRERGYNQSQLIAKGISRVLNIPVDNKIIKRSRYTHTQTQLNSKERLTNVSDAFSASDKSKIKNKTFLLIDDVLTTGATLNACATALLEAGARQVDAATVAMA